jgi:Tfp pilus assembly protein PilF
MDCRKALWHGQLAARGTILRKALWHGQLVARGTILLCVLGGAAGCTRQAVTTPTAPTPVRSYVTIGEQAPPPGTPIHKEADLPKRTPQAKTCTAGGDFLAQEAAAPDLPESVRQQKRDQALKAYHQALATDPHYLPAYLSLGALYMSLKDHKQAVATYEKAIKEYPQEAQVHFALGQCYGAHKDFEAAAASLSKAVDLDPENRVYVNWLGWMQARAGQFDAALDTFRRVNTEAEAQFRLAEMLAHLKRTDESRGRLRAALDQDPDLGPAQALLDKLEGRSSNAVQPATYVEAAKPADDGAAPSAAPVRAPRREGAGTPALLPPPPALPHYQAP